ncbi:ribonuclease R [Tepidibacter formicigenes]|jgi:ribonuclease R|uniref:Ribonuclease R n=1 Tax=Tepidibacter formicigenes DSM 15518 TaxID=1123349 RepID=A0A1M6MKI9_9FIRM|nr:ribonuclease R [Tepidibacter formicigenes]SHJ83793.1 ribonuclease R [Tepidibacter formicigenes DSM 15518]
MIPGMKESLLMFMKENAYNPLTKEELAFIFDIHSSERAMFYNFLDELEEEGYIYKTKKKKYGLPSKMNLFVGRLVTHQRGFGFIISSEEGVEDLFIPANAMNGAMHNDKVIARIMEKSKESRRAEGEIIKIIERSIQTVVGTYESSKNFGFVVADNKRFIRDVYIPKAESLGANHGDKVVCEITQWPKKGRNPEGKIIEILGKKGERGVDILSIIRQHDLPEEFPNKVLAEAEKISEEIPEEEIQRRVDLRNMTIFTIDGADAKDLDDAVSIEILSNGNYKLGVHIADVSHYVKEGTKLDKEALKRGTSVYLIDRVVPMLPTKLSNGVCSLNPNVDRLTLSIFMEIDEKGKVLKHEIVESIINSKARMVYTDVSDILEKNDEELINKYKHLVDDFRNMEKLARILMKKREARGAIDFDFPEAKILLDKKGKVLDVKKYERRIANRIIEEFMLISNETIAEHFFWLTIPFVYRIHETPSAERIDQFNKFISSFGYHIKGDLEEVHPKALQSIVHEAKGKKEELVVNTLMLRSLKQARYSPECAGHFGLAAKYYCHYTSPIRRYPDLQIHRIIKEALNGKLTENRIQALKNIVVYSSEQSSLRERAADDAQREVEDLKKAEYMEDRVGEEFEGVVSSVTSFGIFVELDNTIEGLIRVSNLDDDYYIFDAENYVLIGENTKKTYRIGDALKIKVSKVNIDFKEIEFSIVKD